MARWNADPLVRGVFEEIQALWGELDTTDRPLILRVEQRESKSDWNGARANGRLLHIWLFDDYGARLAPILCREPHDFGGTRGRFSVYGLVIFAIEPDRDRIVLEYQLGFGICGQIHYEVKEEAGEVRLLANSGTLA